jgi:adenine-specific DNA-methyltransferase
MNNQLKKPYIYIYSKDNKLSFDQGGTKHKLILGDNYDALNNLLISYENKIDVIYIDPPYNTGGSSLGYKDRVGKHA